MSGRHLPLLSVLRWRRAAAVTGLVAAAHLVAMLPVRDDWLGVWAQSASVFGQSLILTLPVAVAAATWHFGQLSQSTLGELERTSPRRPSTRELRQVAEFAVVAGAGLVAAAVGVGMATGASATYGGPDLLALGAVVGWMAVAGAVGRRSSSLRPFPAVAPVAGIATYAVMAWVVVRDQGTAAVLAPMDWRWMTLFSKAGWVSLLQAYLAVSLAALIVGLRPGARAVRWPAAAATVVLCTIVVTWGDTASRQPDVGAARLVCAPTTRERVVCLPAVKGYQRDELAAALSRVDASARGLLADDLVFIDDEARGLGRETDTHIDAALLRFRARPTLVASQTVDLSAVTRLPRAEFVAQLVDLMVAPQTRDGGTRAKGSDPRIAATPELVVRSWLYQRIGLPRDGSAYPGASQIDAATVDFSTRSREAEWFAGLADAERQAWWGKHRAELAAGTLQWDAFDD